MPYKIIFLGKLGCGKGTQAEFLSQQYRIPSISTGNMYRREIQAGTKIGIMAYELTVKQGKLMPDDITNELMVKRLKELDCAGGYIIDGYPRTINQAEFIEPYVNLVINIDFPDELVLKRLGGRWIHKSSGRTYHIDSAPPRIPFTDDVTGEPLIQREDDKPEIIKRRLEVFYEQCAGLQNFFNRRGTRIINIDGVGSISEVSQRIESQLNIGTTVYG